MKKLSKILVASIALFAAVVFIGCAPATGGGNGDGSGLGNDFTKPTLPAGEGSNAYLAGHRIKHSESSVGYIYTDFYENGTFEEFDSTEKKQAEGRFSYNESRKVVSVVYEKLANSEGNMCTIEELLSDAELEKTLAASNASADILLIKALYFWAFQNMTHEEKAALGLSDNATEDEVYRVLFIAEVRAKIKDQFSTLWCYEIIPSTYNDNSGTMKLYHYEGTKLTDLAAFNGRANDGSTLVIEKSKNLYSYDYEGSIDLTSVGSFTITSVSGTEIKVTSNSQSGEETMKYENAWNNGAVVVNVTYKNKPISFEEVREGMSYTRISK